MFARRYGVSESELDAFLELLTPALGKDTRPAKTRLALDYTSSPSPVMEGLWLQLGYEVTVAKGTPETPGEVIIVGDYVLDPSAHHRWLREDLAHTPIVFLDQSVVIGPRVVPGVTACLHCVRLTRLSRKPSTPALDSQLWKQRSPLRTSTWEVRAAYSLAELLRTARPSESWRLDARTLDITSTNHELHPDCDCVALIPLRAGQ